MKEDVNLVELQSLYGNKWTMIASFLSGRSDYDIRRRWYSVSRIIWSKKEDEKLRRIVDAIPKMETEINDRWVAVSALMENKSAKDCRDRWVNHTRPKLGEWTIEEDAKFVELQSLYGNNWAIISSMLPGRSEFTTRSRWHMMKRNSVFTSKDTHSHDDTIMKAAISQSSTISTCMAQETNYEHESTSATRAVTNIKYEASESPSMGAKNERKNIFKAQTEGADFPYRNLSKGLQPPFASAHHFEPILEKESRNDKSINKFPRLLDSSSMKIPKVEGEEPSDDEPAFLAYAVAYAATLIHADDNPWLCYTSDGNDSDDVTCADAS